MLAPYFLCETLQRWQHGVAMLLPCEAITLINIFVCAPSSVDCICEFTRVANRTFLLTHGLP